MHHPADLTDTLPTLVDNRPGNTLLDALRRLCAESRRLDVATGFFEIGALLDLDGDWQRLEGVRLLMGDEVTRRTRQYFADILSRPRANGIERAQEDDDWKALAGLEAVKAAILAKRVHARVYTRAKFHAKVYHFLTGGVVNHGLIGSSNFTHPGLTQNLELNLLTHDTTHLKDVAAWYQRAWDEAEDIAPDLLQIIEPHVREYFPFQVYVQAMREYFRDRETDQGGWEHTDSKVYPILAKYQRDAYHDLVAMAEEWGGALLCDGVGLGKTFVAMMLVERALKDRQRVLVVAPTSALESVWRRNLSKFFPLESTKFGGNIMLVPMTDLGRNGGMSEHDVEAIRQSFGVVIVDEAHHFRTPHRNRSQLLKRLVKGKTFYLLTATPINNSLLDLYNLVNLVAQDRPRHFERVGVPNLRAWFGKMMDEKQEDQLQLNLIDTAEYEQFLKHVLVQRSRRYVKSLDVLDDASIKFPDRERPTVITYSLTDTYGAMLPELLRAFDSGTGKLKLVIYETEKFKEDAQADAATLQEQSNVVGLVRTMLLKRLESSQKALEASMEDLLLKHLAVLASLQPIKHEVWRSQHEDLYRLLNEHRRARMDDPDDEEGDSIPATPYEQRAVQEVKAVIKDFGKNEAEWFRLLESDVEHLSRLLEGLHKVTDPKTDAKLKAFLAMVQGDEGLRTKKFVVFSEFRDTARYLEEQLKKVYGADEVVEVDSTRNVKSRDKIIRRFAPYYNCEGEKELQEALAEPVRVLISTDVLSEGLNLQDANQIVNYDLHWNPVRLMQRIGRVDRRMDPAKPVEYDKVYVFNFLPPQEIEDVIHLYSRISGKLIAINKTLGIETAVLAPDDDVAAMDFYRNLGDSSMSPTEQIRLVAHELEAKHPELWKSSEAYPNRIYSGKAGEGRRLFLAYRVPTGSALDDEGRAALTDVRWFMVDTATGKVTDNVEEVHAAIACAEGTPRVVEVPPADRTKWRKKVEAEALAPLLFRAQTPATVKPELICWMEV